MLCYTSHVSCCVAYLMLCYISRVTYLMLYLMCHVVLHIYLAYVISHAVTTVMMCHCCRAPESISSITSLTHLSINDVGIPRLPLEIGK